MWYVGLYFIFGTAVRVFSRPISYSFAAVSSLYTLLSCVYIVNRISRSLHVYCAYSRFNFVSLLWFSSWNLVQRHRETAAQFYVCLRVRQSVYNTQAQLESAKRPRTAKKSAACPYPSTNCRERKEVEGTEREDTTRKWKVRKARRGGRTE